MKKLPSIKVNFKSPAFKLFRNKWFVATALFLVWIIFIDENSIVSHYQNKQRLRELKQQEKYYKKRIEIDRQKLEDLKAGEKKLEKFAREQYYMARPDEEVFIIIDD